MRIPNIRLARITVTGQSMQPTLYEGDRALFTYSPAGLDRDLISKSLGKVVLLRRAVKPELLTIKRLVKELDTGFWVEGDNAESSTDSRQYLTISEDEIVGRMLFRYRRAR